MNAKSIASTILHMGDLISHWREFKNWDILIQKKPFDKTSNEGDVSQCIHGKNYSINVMNIIYIFIYNFMWTDKKNYVIKNYLIIKY